LEKNLAISPKNCTFAAKIFKCNKIYLMAEATIQYNTLKYPNFKEYLWFEAHEAELLNRYFGRYIVVKDEQVIGDYGTRKLARQQTLQQHKPGTFIIHRCAETDPRRAPRLNGRKLVTVDAE
jgi:hypothetical protein